MKSKSFAFAILRIISVWILVQYVIINLITTTVGIYNFINDPYVHNTQIDFPIYSFIMPLFLLIIWSIISWFLWFKAEALSNKLVTTEADENNIESFDSSKIISVSLTILGFYFVVDSIPDLIRNLVYAYNYNPVVSDLEKNKNLIALINPLLTLFIGLFCIMKTENLKSFISKLQKLGIQKTS